MISWPVVVSPVNATLPIPGCAAIEAPAVPPGPVTTLRTPARDARLQRQLAETERRQRRVRRRLEDRGVARGKGRCHLPRGHQQREVPRHDQPHDPDRLAQGQVQAGLRHRDGLAVDLVRGPGVVVEDEARPDDLAAGAGDRLAAVAALQPRELLAVLLDQVGELRQRAPALTGGPIGPALAVLERLLGCGDRAVHVGSAAERCGGDRPALRRIDDVEGPARRPRPPTRRR